MKKYLFSLLPAIALAFLTTLASCKKDEGKLPNIGFISGIAYMSGDKTVDKGQTVLFGIQASKSEDKDILKTFNESVSFDEAAPITVQNITLSGAEEDNYTVEVPITVRNQAGTEKYIFTVTNRDGLTNSVSLTLTVQ